MQKSHSSYEYCEFTSFLDRKRGITADARRSHIRFKSAIRQFWALIDCPRDRFFLYNSNFTPVLSVQGRTR